MNTLTLGKVKPLGITKVTMEKLGAKHYEGKRGRRLHIIFDVHKIGMRSWALLIGLEGHGIRCDGWWQARFIKVYRQWSR
jgi:hypothetical protein